MKIESIVKLAIKNAQCNTLIAHVISIFPLTHGEQKIFHSLAKSYEISLLFALCSPIKIRSTVRCTGSLRLMLVTRTICEHYTVERWNKARTVRNYSVAGLSGARLRSKKIIRVSMISAPCAPCSCICGQNVGKSCSRHPEISSPREIALSHFYLTRLSRTVSNLRRYDTRRAISLTVRQ